MKANEIITLRLSIQRETEKAILVYGLHEAPNENYGLNCWLPKSMLSIISEDTIVAFDGSNVRMANISMPAWLSGKNTVMLHNAKGHYNR